MSGPSEKASRAPGMTDGRPSATGMENEQVVIETEGGGGGGGAPAKVGWRQKGMKDPCCCGKSKLFCMIFIICGSISLGLFLLAIIILILFFAVFAKATGDLKQKQDDDKNPAPPGSYGIGR